MIETQYITLDMKPSGVLPVLYCSQYDIGRPLGMVVYNGAELVDLGDYTVTIEATRTDGVAITAAVTTSGNIGAFETTATMTNKADRYEAQLVLSVFGKRVASLPFVMVVVKAKMDENAESIEEDASLYQQYTETVQTLIADIRATINTLDTDFSAEINELIATDTSLRSDLNAEINARTSADEELSANLTSEAMARSNYDDALSAQIAALQGSVGTPLVASTVSAMTDQTKIYVYTGSETGYTNGHWYYWNGTAWTDGGVYQSSGINTDKTLSVSGMAADALITGIRMDDNSEALDVISDLVSLGYAKRLPVSQATSGYWMNESGAGVAQSGYVFERYVVSAGDTIYVRTVKNSAPCGWRFSTGTGTSASTLVGAVHHSGAFGLYKVPSGATRVFLARLAADTVSGFYVIDHDAIARGITGNSHAIGNFVKSNVGITNADFWLGENGGGEQHSGYTFDRIAVTAGDVIYVKVANSSAPVHWRFASSDSGSYGNIVGDLHREGYEGFVEVPTGATYLFMSRLTSDSVSGVYYPEKCAGVVRGPVFMYLSSGKLNIVCGDTAFGFLGRRYFSLANFSTQLTVGTSAFILLRESGFAVIPASGSVLATLLLTNDLVIGFVWGNYITVFGQNQIIANDAPLPNTMYQRNGIPTYINNKKIRNYAIGLVPATYSKDYGYFKKFINAYADSGTRVYYIYNKGNTAQQFTGNMMFQENTTNIANKKVLCIGDSYTARGWYQNQLLSREATLRFIGTKTTQHGGHLSEGYSGARADQIFGHYYVDLADGQTKVSPFWNPSTNAVDFSYYVQQTGNIPDYIVVMFGLNETNQNNYQNAVQTFINSVRTYSTAIPIYVAEPMTEAEAASDIHNGYNQQNAQYNASLCWNALTGCIHIPARMMMVDEYDYDAASLDYGYGVTMSGLADAVHPSESVGFKKIGDQIYNWLGVTS